MEMFHYVQREVGVHGNVSLRTDRGRWTWDVNQVRIEVAVYGVFHLVLIETGVHGVFHLIHM